MNNLVDRIYVVMASQGDYSDRSEWTVTAYMEKEMAEEHVRLGELECEKYNNMTWDEQMQTGPNLYDPEANYVAEGFWVVEVPLFRHLDEFLENIHKFEVE